MKLTTRLWLFGAAVPFAALAAASGAGAFAFKRTLERKLDDALLAQTGIEAVSLFDSPDEKPHIHIVASPLKETVGRVSPAAALYGTDGSLLARYPEDDASMTDERLDLAAVSTVPELATRRGPAGATIRTATIAVERPRGVRYGLQLAASLAPVDAAFRAFTEVAAAFTLGVGVVLALIQVLVGRSLTARIRSLSAQMDALREGRLDAAPPEPAGDDEIGDLVRAVDEATHRLRMARDAQERLVADAAHELRTPLGLMRTSIDLALRRRRDVPELVQALEETRREVDRLARLSTRLLDLAAVRRAAWDRAPGDLVRVVSEAADAVRAGAEAKGVVVLEDALEPVSAIFDAHGVRQAVDNLLANAIRFSPERGIVVVTVARAGENALLSVHDDGPGIPPEERERVFEPFHRAPHTSGGTGLGLAIVREVARGHGGHAYVADGPGTTVVLEFPARS